LPRARIAITLRLDAERVRRLQAIARPTPNDKALMVELWSVPDNRGVVAVPPMSLQDELTHLAANLVRRRRELLELRGP
jgi:hypothetical protein